MKVKIGDTIYDAQDQPIMVILNDQDKKNITEMPAGSYKYCGYPEGMTVDKVE